MKQKIFILMGAVNFTVNSCSDKITYKINNKHFNKQGSVDSSIKTTKTKI